MSRTKERPRCGGGGDFVINFRPNSFLTSSFSLIIRYFQNIIVKGSQFDTNNDKNLFFWMFEKRTTSLLPSKSSPALKSKWNWPCIFDCEDAPQSPASTDGATNGQASGASSDASSAAVPVDQIPLVVWLTGGPGCSSSLALLTENGPCTVNDDGKTTALNAHSWTESAHVLWLDQPANVGYSYGQDNDTNEEMISEDAYYFLQAFLQSEDGKKYKNNPLFIVGGECVEFNTCTVLHQDIMYMLC